MENKKEYTPEEIIEITINNLNNISVPVGLQQQIGIPLLQNVNNLKEALRIMTAPKEEPIDLGEINLDDEEGEENA